MTIYVVFLSALSRSNTLEPNKLEYQRMHQVLSQSLRTSRLLIEAKEKVLRDRRHNQDIIKTPRGWDEAEEAPRGAGLGIWCMWSHPVDSCGRIHADVHICFWFDKKGPELIGCPKSIMGGIKYRCGTQRECARGQRIQRCKSLLRTREIYMKEANKQKPYGHSI